MIQILNIKKNAAKATKTSVYVILMDMYGIYAAVSR